MEQIQKVYVDALEEYENKKRVKGGCALAKYLLRLIDLRNISSEHSKMLTILPINEEAMPSVVRDIYMQSDKWAWLMDSERGGGKTWGCQCEDREEKFLWNRMK